MLEAAESGPVAKTRMMYSAYLSYAQLKEYLRVLVNHGMLAESEGMLRLRPDGARFLMLYREIRDLLGSGETPLVEALPP